MPGCVREFYENGMCASHYGRWYRHGDPYAGGIARGAALEFFRANLAIRQIGCKIWPHAKHHGYGVVRIDGKIRRVHILACEERHGPKPGPGFEVLHGDCHDRACWNGDHVAWGTRAQNVRDMVRDGTLLRGAESPTAKLTEASALEILSALAQGVTCRELGLKYGISLSQVSKIKNGQRWAHLQEAS